MKTLTLILILLCSRQLLQAQSSTCQKKVTVKYIGTSVGKENDSVRKKFYNLHIVKNFPILFADTKQTMQHMDDSENFSAVSLAYATPPNQPNSAPIKNIKWTSAKTLPKK